MPERKYGLTEKDVIERWAKHHPKVMLWLNRLQKKEENAWNLWLYCKRTNKTPDELLALKRNPPAENLNAAEYLLDEFITYQDLPSSVKFQVSISVKSFYKHNYADLARASGRVEYQRQTPYRKHSKEELLKIYRSTQNPRDRALITFTWSTSITKETLTKIQWKHIEPDWENTEIPHIGLPDKLIKGHGIGKYKGVEQHTFLTPEAKRDLVEYRDWVKRVKGIALGSEDNVFIQLRPPYKGIEYGALGRLALRLSERSGVKFSWHDARRYVETALEETRINPNWARKIRGRKVKGEENPYSRPATEQLRAAYKEAVSLLQFTQPTKVAEADMEKIAKKQVLLSLAKNMGITESDLKTMFLQRIKKPATIDDELEFYEKVIEARRRERENENEDCPNGHNCPPQFEQIKENELLAYLQQGYTIVHRLQSGEVIVKR